MMKTYSSLSRSESSRNVCPRFVDGPNGSGDLRRKGRYSGKTAIKGRFNPNGLDDGHDNNPKTLKSTDITHLKRQPQTFVRDEQRKLQDINQRMPSMASKAIKAIGFTNKNNST